MSHLMKITSYRLLAALMLLTLPQRLEAATVPGDYPTIQAAINAVKSGGLPNGTVIDVSPGTYFEAVQVIAVSRSFTLRAVSGPASTVINASGKGQPAITILNSSGAIRFEGFNVTGGAGGPGTGGGFVVADSSPVFANCYFQGNSSSQNGAGGTLTRSNAIFDFCVFQNNTAAWFGGGVLIAEGSRPTFMNTTIQNNTSGTTLNVGSGGGLHINDSSPTFLNSTIKNNQSKFAGGGIFVIGLFGSANGTATLTMQDCEISDNTSSRFSPVDNPAEGGGVHIEDNAVARLTRCTVKDNVADTGGGLNVFRARYEVNSSFIEANRAVDSNQVGGFGGGVSATSNNPTGPLRQASTVILNDTVVRNNTADIGGGIFVAGDRLCAGGPCDDASATKATLQVTGTLVDSNSANARAGGVFSDRTNLTVTQSQLFRNQATGGSTSFGGGITIVGGSIATISGTTIAANSAQAFGGGLFIDQGATVNVDSSNIYNNSIPLASSPGGGGIYVGNSGGISSGTIQNSIIADNTNWQIAELNCDQSAVNYNGNNIFNDNPMNDIFNSFCAGGATITSISTFNARPRTSGNTSTTPLFGSFAATPDNAPSVLAWSVARPTSIQISGLGGVAGPTASADVTPTCTTAYSLTANTEAGAIGPLSQTVSATGAVTVDLGVLLRMVDYDGDGKDDIAVWRPCSGTWYIAGSAGGTQIVPWGAATDIPVPADYDGDGTGDIAVWRPGDGTWYLRLSTGGERIQNWGAPTDKPVPADYDGDGVTDIAVWRPSDGTWYVLQSTGGFRAQNWGAPTDKPLPADYDGDGAADIAVWRPSDGTWYVLQSTAGFRSQNWGAPTDVPVPADYDGDSLSDIAVWRPGDGTWYLLRSSAGFVSQNWGAPTDIPVPADYDGDLSADIAVWRPSDGTWYLLQSTNGFFSRNWGAPTDVPVP